MTDDTQAEVLWIVGQWHPSPEDMPHDGIKPVRWALQGIFETEAEALKACKALTYFVGPVEVGRELPQQPCAWAGAYWPMIEEQAD